MYNYNKNANILMKAIRLVAKPKNGTLVTLEKKK